MSLKVGADPFVLLLMLMSTWPVQRNENTLQYLTLIFL